MTWMGWTNSLRTFTDKAGRLITRHSRLGIDTVEYTGVLTPSPLAAVTDDYAPEGMSEVTVLRLASPSAAAIGGFAGGGNAARELIVMNVGAAPITLTSQAGSSQPANRFALPADLVVEPSGAVRLVYDPEDARWRAC